jgi:hypothetical protein
MARRVFSLSREMRRRAIEARRESRRTDLRMPDKRTAADRIAVCS